MPFTTRNLPYFVWSTDVIHFESDLKWNGYEILEHACNVQWKGQPHGCHSVAGTKDGGRLRWFPPWSNILDKSLQSHDEKLGNIFSLIFALKNNRFFVKFCWPIAYHNCYWMMRTSLNHRKRMKAETNCSSNNLPPGWSSSCCFSPVVIDWFNAMC